MLVSFFYYKVTSIYWLLGSYPKTSCCGIFSLHLPARPYTVTWHISPAWQGFAFLPQQGYLLQGVSLTDDMLVLCRGQRVRGGTQEMLDFHQQYLNTIS